MKLLIVSNTLHQRRAAAAAGWSATVREIDALAGLFTEVAHVAPLDQAEAGASTQCYRAGNVRLVAVKPGGGRTFRTKWELLAKYPDYTRTLWRELDRADAVHVRCPGNLGLLTLGLLCLRRSPRTRWVKYAGDWSGRLREPLFFRLQRWVLRKGLHRGSVTVNGKTGGGPHVRSFLNPCLTNAELRRARHAARHKTLSSPLTALFVGRLEPAKGPDKAILALAKIRAAGIGARLHLVGDGEERASLKKRVHELGLDGHVHFHGWLSRAQLEGFYARAHFILLPSQTEGWPKVLSEAMAYGAVPIATRVGSIPDCLARFSTGVALASGEPQRIADTFAGYVREPSRWAQESRNAAAAAGQFTYERYLQAVQELLGIGRHREGEHPSLQPPVSPVA